MIEHRLDVACQALGHPTRQAMLAGRMHARRLAPAADTTSVLNGFPRVIMRFGPD